MEDLRKLEKLLGNLRQITSQHNDEHLNVKEDLDLLLDTMNPTTITMSKIKEVETITTGLCQRLDGLEGITDDQAEDCKDIQRMVETIVQKESLIANSLHKDIRNFLRNNDFLWIVDSYREKEHTQREVFSLPFYCNPFGYSMQCMLLINEQRIQFKIHLVKGIYDDLLAWPFSKRIQMTLMNQVNPHGDRTVLLTPNVDDEEQAPALQISTDEHQMDIATTINLTSKDELRGMAGDYVSDFLRNDRIYINIRVLHAGEHPSESRIGLSGLNLNDQSEIETSADSIRKDLKTLNPFIWSLEGVKEKMVRQYHESEAFYTSPFGYRLKCLLKFTENHLGIFVGLVEGEDDGCLKWPFKEKIQMTLINQVDPSKNKDRIITPNMGNPTEIGRWCQPRKGVPSGGQGFPDFISQEDLCGSEFISDFLRNDRILVRIQLV